MENQTCFNLNEALAQWRAELTMQSGVSVEQVRELESHLRDSLTDLQRRGLSEEEAFWLARRRLGSANQITEEIVKVDSSRMWTDRILWMVLGVMVINFCQDLVRVAYQSFVPRQYYRSTLGVTCVYTVLALAAILGARGRFPKILRAWFGTEKVRFSIVILTAVSVPICYWGIQLADALLPYWLSPPWRISPDYSVFMPQLVLNVAWPLVLCSVAVYLRWRLQIAKRNA